ncbi:hypothetical protein GCM10020255_089590 [Rhodococcus baikonurensis]
MEGQLQNWRTVTPTLGKGGLNTIVITWATQNGINLLDLAQNRESIDAATSAACPDVRSGAISALEIPDLASGLVGFDDRHVSHFRAAVGSSESVSPDRALCHRFPRCR